MSDETLRSLVGSVDKLPSPPKIYLELTALLARSAPSVDDIVKVVERDPAMCLKVLQVVNSAFFGLQRRVTGMRDAIAYLGVDLLKSLALAAQIFADAESLQGFDCGRLASLQRHSFLVARLARKLAPGSGDDAFVAGMLHDVGSIVLALADRDRVEELIAVSRERGVPGYVVERERLNVTHAEVGAYILGTWGVPLGVVEAVAGHHEPRRFGNASFDAMTAVHIAEALVTESESDAPAGTLLDTAYLTGLGVLGDLPAWTELLTRLRSEALD
jgi:HD-like signal output (HDOD) protein